MLYVAYGSNLNINQMAQRCPNAKIVDYGYLKGWKLYFNIHLDVFYTGRSEDNTPVAIWEISKEDLKSLDMYEGYPTYYIRKKVVVTKNNGEKVKAIVYVMSKDCKGIYPPFKSYFEDCYDGYNDCNFDTEYLFKALDYSWENQTEHNQYS